MVLQRKGGSWLISLLCLPCSFLTPQVAQKYDLDVPEYEGIDQILELDPHGQKL